MFLVALLVAGNETTRNAITGGLLALSRFPDEHARLVERLDDDAFVDLAVDELIRFVSPVLSFTRTVTEDPRLPRATASPRMLDEGRQAAPPLPVRQPRRARVRRHPTTLRLDRDPNPHIAFGIGTHYCLGANLARMEVKVVFEELLRHLPDLRVPDGARPPSEASRPSCCRWREAPRCVHPGQGGLTGPPRTPVSASSMRRSPSHRSKRGGRHEHAGARRRLWRQRRRALLPLPLQGGAAASSVIEERHYDLMLAEVEDSLRPTATTASASPGSSPTSGKGVRGRGAGVATPARGELPSRTRPRRNKPPSLVGAFRGDGGRLAGRGVPQPPRSTWPWPPGCSPTSCSPTSHGWRSGQ